VKKEKEKSYVLRGCGRFLRWADARGFAEKEARIDGEWYTVSLAGRTSSISNFCFDFFVPDYHYEYLPQAVFQK
jgi:hypothetical protein